MILNIIIAIVVVIIICIFYLIIKFFLSHKTSLKPVETNQNEKIYKEDNALEVVVLPKVSMQRDKLESYAQNNDLFYKLLALQMHQNSILNRRPGLLSIPINFAQKTIETLDKCIRDFEYPTSKALNFHEHPFFKEKKFIPLPKEII